MKKIIYKEKILKVNTNTTNGSDIISAYKKKLNEESATQMESGLFYEYQKTNHGFEFRIMYRLSLGNFEGFTEQKIKNSIINTLYEKTNLNSIFIEKNGEVILEKNTLEKFSSNFHNNDNFSIEKWKNESLKMELHEFFKGYIEIKEEVKVFLNISHLLFDGPSVEILGKILRNEDVVQRKKIQLRNEGKKVKLNESEEKENSNIKYPFFVKKEKRSMKKISFLISNENYLLSEYIIISIMALKKLTGEDRYKFGIAFDCRKKTNEIGFFTRVIPIIVELEKEYNFKKLKNNIEHSLHNSYLKRFEYSNETDTNFELSIGKQKNVFNNNVIDINTDIDVGTSITIDFLEQVDSLQNYCEITYNSGEIMDSFIENFKEEIINESNKFNILDNFVDVFDRSNQKNSIIMTGAVKAIDSSLLKKIENVFLNNNNQRFISSMDRWYTFSDILKEANEIEKLLLKKGIMNQRVAVISRRNHKLYSTLIALLRTDNTFVPILKETTKHRKDEIIINSQAALIIEVENDNNLIITETERTIEKIENELYVMFTSGTTGIPKGIKIGEESAYNNLLWASHEFQINETSTMLFKEKIIFDISIWELYLPLITGCKVAILTDGQEKHIENIKELIYSNCITWVYCMFSQGIELLKVLNQEKLSSNFTFVFGAEPFNAAALPILKAFPKVSFYNTYGPTETTITSSFYKISGDEKTIPIGKPVFNTNLYILNNQMELVSEGVKGMLWIGGKTVGIGYLNNNKLTNQDYIYSSILKDRIYKTGDFVYKSGNEVIYIGRTDSQKKFRGYRIDLLEIEGIIASFKNVDRVVVQIINNRILIASVEIKEFTLENKENIITSANKRLIEYMLPDNYNFYKEFPELDNGKVDIKRLEKEAITFMEQEVEPNGYLNTKEIIVAEIWGAILKTRISIFSKRSNFFFMGGNSIDVPRVVKKVNDIFSVKLTSYDLYKYPTIESITNRITTFSTMKNINSTDGYSILLDEIKCLCGEKL